MTGSPPRFPGGPCEKVADRGTAVEYLQTFRLQLTRSLGQYRGCCWWWVCYCWGDRVTVYCVEGHRFNLIMPEGPCYATPTKLHSSSYSSLAALKNSSTQQQLIHPRQNRLSVATDKGLTLISGVNIDCGCKHGL